MTPPHANGRHFHARDTSNLDATPARRGRIGAAGGRSPPKAQVWTNADARLALDVQDPLLDVPTQGERSPYLDRYLEANTTTLSDVGPATFPLRISQG